MTGIPGVCAGCGDVLTLPRGQDRCSRCRRAARELRLLAEGFQCGWRAAAERVGVAVDTRALAAALEEWARTGGRP